MEDYQQLQLPPGLMPQLMASGFQQGTPQLTPEDKSTMLMKLGLSLMQPVAPGQTAIGAAAQRASGAVDNASAVAEQRKAQAMQGLSLAAQLMKTQSGVRAETGQAKTVEAQLPTVAPQAQANLESTTAGTDLRKASIPGEVARSTVATSTMQSQVDQARAAADTAVIAAHRASESADANIEYDKIENDIKLKKAKIEKDIPDKTVRASVLAEYDKAGATVAHLRAQANEANARGGLFSVEHSLKTKELDGLKDATPEELKSYFSKSGKFSGTKSALDNQAALWGSLYDKLPANDPVKAGKTREQFQLQQLQQAKRKDAIEILTKAKLAGISDEDIADMGLLDMAKEAAAERRGTTTPAAAGPGWGIKALDKKK